MKRFLPFFLWMVVGLMVLGACESASQSSESTQQALRSVDALTTTEESAVPDENTAELETAPEDQDEDETIGEEEPWAPPILSLNGPALMYLKAYERYEELGAMARDYNDRELPVEIIGTVDNEWVNVYTILYRARDERGQVSEASREVHVTMPDYPSFVSIRANGSQFSPGERVEITLVPDGDARIFSAVVLKLKGAQGDQLRLVSSAIELDGVRFMYTVPKTSASNSYTPDTIEFRIGNMNGLIVPLALRTQLRLRFDVEVHAPKTTVNDPEPTPQPESNQSLEPTYQALRFDSQVVRAGEVLIARLAYQGNVSGYSYRLNVGVEGVRLDLPLLEISESELIFSLPIREDSPKGRVSGAQLLWENNETNGLLVNVTWSFNLRIE